MGWVGKNTCLINEEIGSWLFLGEIVTTLRLPADQPAVDRCGTCRRCIDACPTQAITEPYRLDARKCISYLTIEHRGEVDPKLAEKFGNWIYGCDICQDVCPWNSKAIVATEKHLQPRFEAGVARSPPGAFVDRDGLSTESARQRNETREAADPATQREDRIDQ